MSVLEILRLTILVDEQMSQFYRHCFTLRNTRNREEVHVRNCLEPIFKPERILKKPRFRVRTLRENEINLTLGSSVCGSTNQALGHVL